MFPSKPFDILEGSDAFRFSPNTTAVVYFTYFKIEVSEELRTGSKPEKQTNRRVRVRFICPTIRLVEFSQCLRICSVLNVHLLPVVGWLLGFRNLCESVHPLPSTVLNVHLPSVLSILYRQWHKITGKCPGPNRLLFYVEHTVYGKNKYKLLIVLQSVTTFCLF